MVVVTNEEELKEAVTYAKEHAMHPHILGGGTNSYFAERLEGYLFIKLELQGIQLFDDGKVIISASEEWDTVVYDMVQKGFWGIENLSHIPGTAGAAPVQNIGAYGVELKDTLLSVRALDMETLLFADLSNEDCRFGYRDSIFKQEKGRYVIVSLTLQLSKEPRPVLTYRPLDMLLGREDSTLAEIRALVIATRDMKLPDWNTYPNTGSFFKNPLVSKEEARRLKDMYPEMVIFEKEDGSKVSAAWLIEHVAKMKGVREGNVGTWPNQPLVIVNYGEATAEEVNVFAESIQKKIKDATGLQLEREVNYVKELQK